MGIWDKIRKLAFEQEDTYNDQEIIDQPVVNPYKVAVFDLSNASIEEKIEYILTYRSHGEQIQYADKLLQEGPHELAVYMYQQLAERYPAEKDRYENGAGLALVKMGKNTEAIEYFKAALRHGMHPDITDKLIWQAVEANYKASGSMDLLCMYEQEFPNGKYIAEVVKILYPTEDLVLVQQKSSEIPFELTNPEALQKITLTVSDSSEEQPKDDPEEVATMEQGAETITITLQDHTAAIEAFLEEYFEPSNIQMFYDEDEELPIHIYHVSAQEDQPFHILISNGMSRVDMPAPLDAQELRCAELMCLLPPEMSLSSETLQDNNANWPLTWMRTIARLSIYEQKWFTYGSMFSNAGNTIGDTEFTHLIMLNATTIPEDLQEIKDQDKTIILYALIPLLPEEAELRRSEGVEALIKLLAAKNVRDIISKRN
jgi:tetratricopeptide (TPR) repeat protein